MKRLPFAALLLWLAGCGSVMDGFDFDKPHPDCPHNDGSNEALQVRYLGTGGVYLEWKNEGMLIGPFFSNPGMLRTYFWGNIRPNERLIRDGLKDVKNVRAIFVGHSHYDHLGDLPTVASRYPNAEIYVNESGVKVLPRSLGATPYEKGDPIPVGNAFTVTAVKSDHAPQLCRWRHFPCTFAWKPLDHELKGKWTDHNWRDLRLGNPHAFIIDLKGTNFRIYYNDSAVRPEVVANLPDQPVDLAIITVASFDKVKDYPAVLLQRIKPRHVLLSHYENFFREYDGHFRFAPLLTDRKAKTFTDSVSITDGHPPENEATFCGARGRGWSAPVPGQALYFKP